MNPLVAQLAHQAFPELAQALRTQTGRITLIWDKTVRRALPQTDYLTFEQLKDSLPEIMTSMADALASDEPDRIRELVEQSRVQGLTRFQQHYDVNEIMEEDRLLRAIVVRQVEESLSRQLTPAEAAALHATLDVMLQQAVVSLVKGQQEHLRSAVEMELKFLAFLSHELNNNLSGVTLLLGTLRQQLAAAATFSDAVVTLDLALHAIQDTVAGMRKLLQHERLRKNDELPRIVPFDLQALCAALVRQFAREAQEKGLEIATHVEPHARVDSDRELVSLTLQNFLGNAVKYSAKGTIRLAAQRRGDRWVLSVSDQGPGIPAEHLQRIFTAFRRGEAHGQPGVGLGLAIAAQAAKLLRAETTCESEVGKGSTFHLILPPPVASVPDVSPGGTSGRPGRPLQWGMFPTHPSPDSRGTPPAVDLS